MKNIFYSALLTALFSTGSVFAENPPKTVEHVDLERYTGTWYEIAKLPNRFQKKCAFGTTANYTLMDNGSIRVINRCYKENGQEIDAKGQARIVDSQSNAKLQVSFVRFFWRNWFWGDYWIIGLDDNYQWAIVGHPEREYGWILARTPQINDEIRQQIDAILTDQGYNPDDFVNTIQTR